MCGAAFGYPWREVPDHLYALLCRMLCLAQGVALWWGCLQTVRLDQVATVPRPGLEAHAFAVKEARDHAWDTDLPVH